MRQLSIFVLVLLMLNTLGCQTQNKGNKEKSNASSPDQTKYIAVLDGKIGFLSLPEQEFENLSDGIYSLDIVGVINDQILVVKGGPWDNLDSVGYLPQKNLYLVNIMTKEIYNLANNIDSAWLSPNKKTLAYIFNTKLYCMDFDSLKSWLVDSDSGCDNLNNPWSPDGNRLVYDKETLNGNGDWLVYDLNSKNIKELTLPNDQSYLYVGWVNNDAVLFNTSGQTDSNSDVLSLYNMHTDSIKPRILNKHFQYTKPNNNTLLGFNINSTQTAFWEAYRIVLDDAHETRLFEAPFFFTDEPDHNYEKQTGTFISKCSSISDNLIFFRLSLSENEKFGFSCIVNSNSGERIDLNKNVFDIGV